MEKLKVGKELGIGNLLLSGSLMIIVGVVVLVGQVELYETLLDLVAVVILLNGFTTIFRILTNGKQGKEDTISISGGLLTLAIGACMLIFPTIPLSILPILAAIYILLNALVKGINYIILRQNQVSGRLIELLTSLAFLVFAIILLFSPIMHLESVLNIIGIYCILLGITFIGDFLRAATPNKTKNRLKRRIRISLPVILVAFIPHSVLKKVNEFLSIQEEQPETIMIKKEETEPDLEILIHVTEDGAGMMGHCDLYFEGKVISYGNYDASSAKLFTAIGDGVLFMTHKEKYIPLCIKNDKKTLFGFGIKLDETQKQAVRERIHTIEEQLYPWECPYERDQLAGLKLKKKEYQDYASKLYFETGAKLYKFNSGKFKTYFVLSTNCVLLADTILGASGSDIVKMNGIITPGTYYDYLDRLYRQPNTNVITRNIYR